MSNEIDTGLVSPPSAAEQFFLSLPVSDITAIALASSLKDKANNTNISNHSSANISVKSVGTDGYVTADEGLLEEDCDSVDLNSDTAPKNNSKTVTFATNMPVADKKIVKQSLSEPATVEPVIETETAPEVNATQNVYETVKNVWGAASGIGVFSPFLKTAEGVVDKVLGVKGLDLHKVDAAVKPLLANVDGAVNPHIAAVLELVKPIVEKIMPVVMMTPVGMLLEEKKVGESETTPEVTPSPVVQ
eukprot:CAMPEP_0116013164 /NCGR_PEP_ID=MMETSP0321-20121206/5566_1 /TAXON_ID=163516 /ORGANISM="Leptocylindrus danicus var. danicus, Strain B650" /LENGTH=245 /DNA_ID=CAMNT_0003482667 /DNA_START=185 /DNA_END=922 /DNA_ORIENTATION=-